MRIFWRALSRSVLSFVIDFDSVQLGPLYVFASVPVCLMLSFFLTWLFDSGVNIQSGEEVAIKLVRRYH